MFGLDNYSIYFLLFVCMCWFISWFIGLTNKVFVTRNNKDIIVAKGGGGKGGGSPQIQGGMTKQEYDLALQQQENRAREAEFSRQMQLLKYEEERKRAEKDQIQLAKQLEKQSIADQRDAEEEVSQELSAQVEKRTSNWDEMTEEEKQKLSSMFGSLYSGQQQERPT